MMKEMTNIQPFIAAKIGQKGTSRDLRNRWDFDLEVFSNLEICILLFYNLSFDSFISLPI